MAEGTVSPPLLFVCLVLLTARAQDDIRVPPQIIQPVVFAKKFYLPSATMVLMCNATGTPKPTYVWYRNGVEVQSSTRLGISLDAKTGVLKIKPFTVDREGVFRCRAKNAFPERVQTVAVSAKIEARVARISGWPAYRVVHVSKELEEGDYGSITCADRYPTSIGSTRIVWYYRVQRRQRPLQPNERTYMASKGTVHFAYVLRSDQRSGAEYYCAVNNVARGSLSNAMKKTKLIIKQKNPVPESAPVLRFSTQSLGPEARTFKRNSVARLECFFSGYVKSTKKADKVPTITWKDSDGNEITNVKGRYSIESYGRVLKIENLVETDEKSYTCTGVNKLGRAEGTIHINITSTPIWVKPLKSMTVVQGDSAIFYCQSRSSAKENPPSEPTWTMNGQPFSVVDPKKYAFADNSQGLTVKSAQKSKDITCFQCYVSNSVGEEFGNGCLNVILPIRITTRPKSVQAVGRGDTVNLTVVAVSDRLFPVSYRWILRSKLYEGDQAPPHVFYNVSSGLAYINTANLTDEEMLSIKGVYRREVFHQLQKVVVNVDVRIKTAQENGGSGKGDKKSAAVFTTVNFGLFAGLLLAIILVILLVGYIRCRKNGVKPAYTVPAEVQQQRSVAQVPSAKFTNRRSSNRSQTSVHPYSASVVASAIEDDLSSYATSDASDALTDGESNILVESSAISFGPPSAQRMGTPSAHSFMPPTAQR